MRTLFVTQLQSDTNEEMLRSVFEEYGPVKRTKIIAYPWGKNCAFLEFEQESDCQDALVDIRYKQYKKKRQWKACYAHSDEPEEEGVEEIYCNEEQSVVEGVEEVDWLENLYGFPNHESHSYLSSLSVDTRGLQEQIDDLLSFYRTPAPSVNKARGYIKNLMEISGLTVREDAFGNIIGRWEGLHPELSAVATGSHIDALPYSSKFGVVGVLGAIEAVNILRRSGFKPKRSLEVIMYTSEESTSFGISCLGSRLMAGSDIPVINCAPVDDQFLVLARERHCFASSKNAIYSAFVELHIEQGPILEQEDIPIGIVSSIEVPSRIIVEFQGYAGRSMHKRNEAGLAAAALAIHVERDDLCSSSLGSLELHTGAINSVPSLGFLKIDIQEYQHNPNVVLDIYNCACSIAEQRGVILSEFKIIDYPPALPAGSIIHAIEDSSKKLNLSHKLMKCQGYHDSLFMARKSPVGMICIPCYKGYRQKEEWYSSHDLKKGIEVLALTLAKLALQ